jgi:multiple sugar transport system permease protein
VLGLMLATMVIPFQLTMIPTFLVMKELGLIDTLGALIIPSLVTPLSVFLFRQFFVSLPRELEEAAWIDGCGVMGGLLRVVLPLSLPGAATIAVLAFILSMQEYLYAVVLASPVEHKVVTVGLPTMLVRYDVFFWGALMAGALLVGIPTAIAFTLVLDRFIRGITS